VAIISIIAAIAVPGLLRARMTGNETSAIASLKVTTSSQVRTRRLAATAPTRRRIVVLGTAPAPGGRGLHLGRPRHERDAAEERAYNFALGAGAGSAAGSERLQRHGDHHGVLRDGVPMTNGTTGTRSFAVNAGNTIWQLTGAAASDASRSVRRRRRFQ
jgi:type II secretory pathway pseudopilin PulG